METPTPTPKPLLEPHDSTTQKPKQPFPPFPNGSLKKHTPPLKPLNPNPNPNPNPFPSLYRECLKNHAATLGGHALDGCGEFMPVPASTPLDPTSLKCAACGCHRNFHRRLPDPPPPNSGHHHLLSDRRHLLSDDDDVSDEDDDVDDNDDNDHRDGGMTDRTSSPQPTYFSSAPHMLLALSTGAGVAGTGAPAMPVPAPGPVRSVGPAPVPVQGFAPQPRKRFRTKFSAEQKERMHELSEKLGWRLQKRDEGLVEQWCREIGVGKGVFKVWMHNNKHVFLGTGKRGESRERVEREGGSGGVAVGVARGEGGEIGHVINGNGGGGGGSESS